MGNYNDIQKEIDGIKLYIENIIISDYKNCFLPEKLDIISNLYFLYNNMSDYINKLVSKDSDKMVIDNIMKLIEDIRIKVMILKLTLINIEKNHKKTDETISFKDYISKNQELLEMYIARNGLQGGDIETLIKT